MIAIGRLAIRQSSPAAAGMVSQTWRKPAPSLRGGRRSRSWRHTRRWRQGGNQNMRNIDKISFPYRAQTHLTLLHVVAESGAWAKHGLEVNYNFQISMSDAHRAVTNGE